MITCKTTRYGLSLRAGGWDPYGDSGTDAWQGNHGNTLNTSSCALTVSAERALSPDGETLTPGQLLRIVWPGTHLVRYVTFDDRAPESDPRLDIFLPWKDDPMIPDFGEVSLVYTPKNAS